MARVDRNDFSTSQTISHRPAVLATADARRRVVWGFVLGIEGSSRMSYAMKIKKAKGAAPDDFEAQVAQELMNLEVATVDMKAELHDLYIVAAKELELPGGRKAIVIFVPFKQLKDFHKIQGRLIRELEKKFRCAFAYLPSTPPPLLPCITHISHLP